MKKSHIIFLVCMLSALIIVFSIQMPVSGFLSDIEEDIERTRTEIAEFEKLIQDIENEIVKRTAHIESLGLELQLAQEALIYEKENMETAQADEAESMNLFAGRLRSSYMKHNVSYLEVLFQAESFADIIIWWVYLTRIFENDARIITDLELKQSSIAQKRLEIEQQMVDLDDLRNRIQAEQQNLDSQRKEKEQLLASAKDRLESEIAELARLSPRAEHEPVYAVVIDNLKSARPHHGINEASIIYEYEVEGGITRYLALFSSFPTKVGPVRSARVHSAILALENNATYVHAGGGVDVLSRMRSLGVKSVNELAWDGEGFFRDNRRRAPHNLFVNLRELGVESRSERIVMRPAFIARRGTSVNNVSIEFNRRHTVSYTYLPQRESYRKIVNGERSRDAQGRQIFARNIIVMYAPYGIDLFLRPTANLIGEGEIDFYSMGQHFEGTWRKQDNNSPIQFFFQDGTEISRVYGQTWIHIVRAE